MDERVYEIVGRTQHLSPQQSTYKPGLNSRYWFFRLVIRARAFKEILLKTHTLPLEFLVPNQTWDITRPYIRHISLFQRFWTGNTKCQTLSLL